LTSLDLELATAALAASLAVGLKAPPLQLPGDAPEDHEDNTYDLPEGSPIRKVLRRYFRDQMKRMTGFVAKIGGEIPRFFPKLSDYDDPMAAAMTPILGVYWDRSGKALRGRLGLDPDEWRVTDPNVHQAVAEASLKFCAATNATTDKKVAEAREAVRDALSRGLVGHGETVPQLTARIKEIFQDATTSRAKRIAQTEASRAVHAASEMSAVQSRVVRSKRILLSSNSCPVCVQIAQDAGSINLGEAFGRVGHDPDYSSIRMPPIHPHCRCSVVYDLIEQFSEPVPAYDPAPKEPAVSPHETTGSGGLAEGVQFNRTPAQASRRDVLVSADVAKLDAALAMDAGFHVGPNGTGAAVPGRYAEARRFLEKAQAEGESVLAAEIALLDDGTPSVVDGRHRLAVLRDSGATVVPVVVSRGQSRRFRRLFGQPKKEK
jgi:hypothetical protein